MNHKTLARLADSSATARFNDTNVLVTVVNKPKSPPATFLPLTVIINTKINKTNIIDFAKT